MIALRVPVSRTLGMRMFQRQWLSTFAGLTPTQPKNHPNTRQQPLFTDLSDVPNYGSFQHLTRQALGRLRYRHPVKCHENRTPKQCRVTFANLLAAISDHLRSVSNPSIPYLHYLLHNYDTTSTDWLPYAYADPFKSYTRNLVYEIPGVYNLMILVWTPDKGSPVHDHTQSHCLMKMLRGTTWETRFAIPSGNLGRALEETSRRDCREGSISYICDDLGLHSVSNLHPSNYAVSLHLYTPPNAALRGCHVYDMENGGARHVLQGPCDSIRGVAAAKQARA